MAKKKLTKEEEVAAPAQPAPEEQATAQKGRRKGASITVSSAFLVSIGVLAVFAYLIFATMQAFRSHDVAADGEPQALATPAVPTLKLNQDNQRQGPEIIVDTESIGKQNPFQ